MQLKCWFSNNVLKLMIFFYFKGQGVYSVVFNKVIKTMNIMEESKNRVAPVVGYGRV